ncbi:2,3-dihydro-2,3-dihydroxybenzoate dehydrogenase [Streptomyces sp. NPDC046385]|uniref:2,3-dihydro-2,3-dihydroxybenzoate dehydrogenase n=1 Tax=unclassified Streptomyces TaxID=2593676 RepID=UPI0033E26F3A
MSTVLSTGTEGISGRVAVVTGAGQGIGAAVARLLGVHGAQVALWDAAPEPVTDVAAELDAAGVKNTAMCVDVRDSAAVEAAAERVERELGPVDLLVNVAGVLRTGAVLDLADEAWDEVFGVNVRGVFAVSRSVAGRMAGRGRGAVVTVASNAGGVPRVGMGAYAASKAASSMLTKCLGLELAGRGVRCNVVSPGSTDTPMLRDMWDAAGDGANDATVKGSLEAFRVGIPLGRVGTAEQVAQAVLFLLSDQASHITLQDLYVDGGAALG